MGRGPALRWRRASFVNENIRERRRRIPDISRSGKRMKDASNAPVDGRWLVILVRLPVAVKKLLSSVDRCVVGFVIDEH